MSSRHALVVGSQCEALRNQKLSFLPARAERLYAALTNSEMGGCDPAASTRMLDPTLSQLKDAVRAAVVKAAEARAVLVFAFIGHAVTREDKHSKPLYLLPRDGEADTPTTDTAYEIGHQLGDLDLSGLGGLILLLDVCHAGAGVRDVMKHGLDFKDQVRLELLAGTFLRVARNGCFSESLVDVMEHGRPGLSVDYLDIRHAANAAADTCRPVQDPPVYIGSGFGQDSSDPGLWVTRNIAAPGYWSLSGTAEGAQAVALTRSYQITDVLEPVAEALETSPLTVVVGGAGSGKSSLVSALARSELVPFIVKRFLSAVAFVPSLNGKIIQLAKSLAAQLGRLPGFEDATASYRVTFDDDEMYKAQPAFERLVFGPLRRMAIPVGQRVRLAIDGIDQLEPEARSELIGMLAAVEKDPALKRVGVLVTGRPSVLPEFDRLADAVRIDVGRPRPDDVVTYLKRSRVPEQVAKALEPHTWTWLELQLLADLGSRLAETPVADRSFNLGDLYDQCIASAVAAGGKDAQAVLVVLAAAGTGPTLPIGVAADACSLVQASVGGQESSGAKQEVDSLVPRLRRILADLRGMSVRADPGTDAELLGLFHETLTQHIAVQRDWGVSVKDGHTAILSALKDASGPSALAYRQTRGPDHLWALGDYHEALTRVISGLGHRAADNRSLIALWTARAREVLPGEDADLLGLRGHLARWTGEAGEAGEAIAQYRTLIEDRVRVFGADHPDTLTTRSGLIRWLGKSGKVTEAIEQNDQLLEDQRRVLGPDHPETLTTRHELARWTGEAGNVADAITLFTRLLEDRIRVLGPDHPQTLKTQGSLARWTGEAGNEIEAMEQFRRLLQHRIRVLGRDHPHTMITRHDLARWTGRAGSATEAMQQYRRLLEDQTSRLGPDHPHTLATRHDLAYWTGKAGNLTEAVEQNRRLLEDQIRLLGLGHRHTQATRENLAYWAGEMRNEDGSRA